MSVFIFSQENATPRCIAIADASADPHAVITPWVLEHANAVMQLTPRGTALIVEPPTIVTYQRADAVPGSVASYPVGSVIATQAEGSRVIVLNLVILKNAGWVVADWRHRKMALGQIEVIPATEAAMDSFSRSRSGEIYQTLEHMRMTTAATERKFSELVSTNKCLATELYETHELLRESHINAQTLKAELDCTYDTMDLLEAKMQKVIESARANGSLGCALATFNTSAPEQKKMV